MARSELRIAFIQAGFIVALLLVAGRAIMVQVFQSDRWAAEAALTRTDHEVVPARRGDILDRNGRPLAVTSEIYHIGIAPNEVRDLSRLRELLVRDLGLSSRQVKRDFGSGQRWIYYGGPFTADEIRSIRELRGVHPEVVYSRTYQNLDLARSIIGRVAPDEGEGKSGLEFALDSILTGIPGERIVIRDARGRRYASPSREIRDPVPGADVYLTLDVELQEIAEASLASALREYDADGGDIVMLDPRTGEILALASVSSDGSSRPTPLTDPYEPGSTVKVFTAAALLSLGRVDSTMEVSAEDGSWRMPVNESGTLFRTIEDAHPIEGSLTLAEAIQYSSNIAMGKFSQMLTPVEQYDQLRDFGFGSPTGVEFPSESRGTLAPPHEWDFYTQPSLAMGYEFQVTPLQLAAAYAAIANDGILLSPTLIREIRSPDGTTIYRHHPEPIRRAVTPAVARKLRGFLREAAGEEGTGSRAQLAGFTTLGKTGTAKQLVNGRYGSRYAASFASIFPAEEPQLVTLVKLDNPADHYYGGQTAAPLTRDILVQAMASDRVALDRARIGDAPVARPLTAPADPEDHPAVSAVLWPLPADSTSSQPAVAVPDVSGKTVREAALQLHRRGFHVALNGLGIVERTVPASGASLRPGSTVTVWAGELR